MSWILADGDGVILRLHIQPGAKKTEIAGLHGEALKMRLAAPPVDGKANASLIEFLARQLGVSKSAVELVSGETSRAKRVRVGGITADAAKARLRGCEKIVASGPQRGAAGAQKPECT